MNPDLSYIDKYKIIQALFIVETWKSILNGLKVYI